jgi:hypothetical protein
VTVTRSGMTVGLRWLGWLKLWWFSGGIHNRWWCVMHPLLILEWKKERKREWGGDFLFGSNGQLGGERVRKNDGINGKNKEMLRKRKRKSTRRN